MLIIVETTAKIQPRITCSPLPLIHYLKIGQFIDQSKKGLSCRGVAFDILSVVRNVETSKQQIMEGSKRLLLDALAAKEKAQK